MAYDRVVNGLLQLNEIKYMKYIMSCHHYPINHLGTEIQIELSEGHIIHEFGRNRMIVLWRHTYTREGPLS